jgi:hypothetical protein
MSNRNYTAEELSSVLASMGVTDQIGVSRYGSGHINDTFKVETARGTRFILQRVNTDIFPPDVLKSNILRVTGHLKSKGVKSLDVVGYENPWRLYTFLEGYKSVDIVTNPAEAELAAGAFADVVVWKEDEFRANATYDDPHQFTSGVKCVMVNGVVPFADGKFTGNRSGRFLERK